MSVKGNTLFFSDKKNELDATKIKHKPIFNTHLFFSGIHVYYHTLGLIFTVICIVGSDCRMVAIYRSITQMNKSIEKY